MLLLPLISFMASVSRKLTELWETSCVNLRVVFPLRYSMNGVKENQCVHSRLNICRR